MMTMLLALLLACSASGGDSDSGTADTDSCVSEAVPAVSDPLKVSATVYDPVEGCWAATTVQLSDALWSAYDTRDTGAPSCDDVTVMLARADCSCVRLGSSCGDVAASKAADDSVLTTAEAEDRCVQLEATAPACP